MTASRNAMSGLATCAIGAIITIEKIGGPADTPDAGPADTPDAGAGADAPLRESVLIVADHSAASQWCAERPLTPSTRIPAYPLASWAFLPCICLCQRCDSAGQRGLVGFDSRQAPLRTHWSGRRVLANCFPPRVHRHPWSTLAVMEAVAIDRSTRLVEDDPFVRVLGFVPDAPGDFGACRGH
jgi:hypothetical protein